MSITSRERRKYLKDISKQLVCSRKTRKKYLSDISGTVDDFIENNSGASLADLYENVGSPSEIANNLLINENAAALRKKNNNVNQAAFIFIAILIIAIMVAAAAFFNECLRTPVGGTVITYEVVSDTDGSVEEKMVATNEFIYDNGDCIKK